MLKYLIFALAISCTISQPPVPECGQRKYLESSKCKSCPKHLNFCNSKNAFCDDGFFLNQQTQSCSSNSLLKIQNCAKVTDQTKTPQVCTACRDGYWLKSDNSCNIKKLVGTCLTWVTEASSTESCATLKDGFSFVGGKIIDCTKIDPKCIQCNSATSCIKCDPLYYIGSKSLSCKVKTGNCLTWKLEDIEQCLSCPVGYQIIDKKYCYAEQCSPADIELSKKSIGKNKNLWTKKVHLVETAACKDTNCLKCASTGKSCTACKAGFYLDKTKEDTDNIDAVCIPCIDVNAKYQDTSCTNTQRVKFPWTCAALTENCAVNQPTPLIGESSQSCKACQPGYWLQSQCKKCPENCKKCADNSCSECNIGYYANSNILSHSNICSACDSTCLQCSSSGQICVNCKLGYAFQSSDSPKCVPCKDKNCERCDVQDICIACKNGFFVKDKACTACSKNCLDCDDSSTCNTCKVGTYLKGKVCDSCINNCKACADSTKCITCRTGYDLNADKTTCTKSTSVSNECLKLVTGCSKCDAAIQKTCVLCKSGSTPVGGKCTCETGKILIAGTCVTQSTVDLPKDLSTKNIDDLTTYVTKALQVNTAKAANTKNILARVNAILSSTSTKNDKNAEKSLSLLIQLADAATDKEAQVSYTSILSLSCAISDLSQSNFYLAFAAADKFLTTATNKKEIFELGFSTCLTNLLRKGNNVADISLMSLANSEFQMVKFTQNEVNDNLDLTGISITINEAFMNAVGDGTYYAAVQAFPNTANPYAKSQKNSGSFSLASKIVSFKVLSAGENAQIQKITLNDGSFPITFDNAGTAGKCGYYNTETDKWKADGTLKDKTCSYTHLTDFAIYAGSIETYTDDKKGAYMLQVLSVIILFIIALF